MFTTTLNTRSLNPIRPIRNTRTPLTMDMIRAAAPSAFAADRYHGTSERYSYIPTVDVIEGMMKAGFQPFAASQSRTSIEDKREHTKHMIRFRTPDLAVTTVGDVFPEVVLVNSHDGTSAYKRTNKGSMPKPRTRSDSPMPRVRWQRRSRRSNCYRSAAMTITAPTCGVHLTASRRMSSRVE